MAELPRMAARVTATPGARMAHMPRLVCDGCYLARGAERRTAMAGFCSLPSNMAELLRRS